jgi:hypothetical protein
MNIAQAMNKLRVMLAAEAVKVVSETFASVSLVDGTVVFTEGELVEGAALYVEVAEGEAPVAPAGVHETVDGMLITVGENGVIEKIEEVVAEEAPAVEEEVVVEETMAETFNAEELLGAIAEMIKSYQSEITSVTEEMATLKERFEAVAGEPAAKPVKHNFGADAKAAREVELSRFDRLVALKKK